MSKNEECVKVAVRCRPLSANEQRDDRATIVDINLQRGEVAIRNPKGDQNEHAKTFTFDAVYNPNSTQEEVYSETAHPIIDSVLEGYNGTIFAYGQTGTGKTYTMEGSSSDSLTRGIIPRAFEHIFNYIQGTPDKQFLVYASFLEIYNEELRDLLAPNHYNKLELREKPEVGVYVKDLTRFPIHSIAEMNHKLHSGRKSRHVGETEMNRESSRSHAIFTITVEASEFTNDGKNHIYVGKLNLVDLAGSERQAKTKSSDVRLQEAININKSLSTLGNVISALVDPKSTHIPYRDSKLTRLLQDSLGGNAKTVMIANIGPADWNFEESLTTLRYANRAKNIKNKPKINEDPKDALIREFQNEILRLKEELEQFQGEKNPLSEKMNKQDDEQKIKEMERKLHEEKEEIKKQAELERRQIEDQKNLAEEEKVKLLADLKKKEEAQKTERESKEMLLKKLKKMEQKVLIGTKAMEQAINQEKEFQRVRQELEEKRAEEHRLAEELAKKEEENILMEKKFASRQDDLEDKKRKLQRLYQIYQTAKSEIQDLCDEMNREREEFQSEVSELSKDNKLKNLIIDSFIPKEEVRRIKEKAIWNDEVDDWIIPNRHLAGNNLRSSKPGSALGLKRPTSNFGRKILHKHPYSARFKQDNVLKLGLDMPERTLEDMTTEISSKIRQTITSATTKNEEELLHSEIDLMPNVYQNYPDETHPHVLSSLNTTGSHPPPDKENVRSSTDKFAKNRAHIKSMVASSQRKRTVLGERNEQSSPSKENFPKSRGLVRNV